MTMELSTKTPEKATPERRWPPPQGEWTYEDYGRLPDNGMRYEVIRGELYMSPAPRPIHQKISVALTYIFCDFVEAHNLGDVYHAPIDVNLPNLTSPVQPDLLFVASDNLNIVKDTRIEGVPDLIVEILSPSNPDHDQKTKFEVYASAGVREYWIVNPDKCIIDIFVLRGQAYAPLGSFGLGDEINSEVLPNFKVSVSDVCK